jgi:hypothetical protein
VAGILEQAAEVANFYYTEGHYCVHQGKEKKVKQAFVAAPYRGMDRFCRFINQSRISQCE